MIHTEETRQKLSDMRKGSANPFFGQHHSDETKQRLSEITRRTNGDRQYVPSPLSIKIPGGNDLAYLAGIIDGEGSIRFRRNRPFIAVYNSHRGLIDWLLERVGGAVAIDHRGRVLGYQWSVQSAQNVYHLSVALKPHLIVKIEDAEAAISHLEAKYGAGHLNILDEP